ncbi:tRNA (adenosine(37)-N6)-threonylcarbamoyltransferase complex dimerization subunit type 1 TsaB [Paenibacillus motobuensis]|uniref:tRNA (adenosine(37)-N6)-threonylcarbamoyltransferase complex dimerization subunit type 1 TsaB n=1 Tax=Paenibacillus TaxID=44249 RepID=UPI002040FB8A|nr:MULTISPECIES: tRNA (adenosine(37)-N6)-threonylcarbamoyltransferase complex dimerization subunit type 1 TsaB [Paenibacillus]MCM3042880.1 tRNA (adenosine(37)-N6)-threonylcarbamoyltransferase complex dimerization subunit type 1 TsaB [Paenibacillus lutimineralis]MCM3649984.1 tRNA (adenosine(37)-N6)-threonylcarbamoyltransferase complex dimerization subunit type 1 TsaB [Paenibacillus motobuensis]
MNIDGNRPQQRLLAFDTSTSSLAVAVMENGTLLAEQNIHAERNHSAYLVTAIEKALEAAGITKQELDGIAVGVGPGSYTGIRIAVTTAKTLAWALKIPVFGISSLEATALGAWAKETGQDTAALGAYAMGDRSRVADATEELSAAAGTTASAREHWIIPLVDARRGQVYTALFSAQDNTLTHRLEQDGIRLMDRWIEQLAELLQTYAPEDRPEGIWIVGDIALHEAAAEALRPLMGDRFHIVSYELEGIWMGIAGTARSQSGAGDDVHAIEPNYTQLAEAEAKRLRNA